MKINSLKYYGCCAFLMLLSPGFPAQAQGPGAWHWRNPLPQGDDLRSVTHGNGTFVAVGERGVLFKSPDGVVWSLQRPVTNSLFDVTFATGLFVAVGGEFTPTTSFSGDIYTSANGAQWTKQVSDTTQPLTGIAYGAGKFVAVGPRGVCSVSANGQTWTSHPSPNANSVAMGPGGFVAVGDYGGISTSTDGLNWTTRVSGTSEHLYRVAFGNGSLVAVGANGMILTSPTGETWNVRNSGATEALHGIAFMDGTFVAAGDRGTILRSTTGTAWARSDSGEAANFLGIAGSDGTFAAVGTSGMIITSLDSVAWSRRTVAATVANLNGVTFGIPGFVAVGEKGTVLSSVDGLHWTLRSSGVTNELFRTVFANDRFVAVGSAGMILSSSNAIDWQERASGSTLDLRGIAFGNGIFLAVGETVLTSATGDSWTPHAGAPGGLLSVTFGQGKFVTTASRGGNFMVSSNGNDWRTGDFIQPVAYYDVAFGRRTFLAVGDSSTHNPFYIFQQSTNGLAWDFRSSVDGDGQHELMGVAFGNSMFVSVGRVGTVLSSMDEETFHESDSGTAVSLRAVAYGSGTFVAVGEGGAILQSDPVSVLGMANTTNTTPSRTLTLSGTAGSSYRIEGSETLGPAALWQTLANITLVTNQMFWTDPQPSHVQYFYRVSANDNLIANGDFESPGFTAAPDYRYLTSTESFSPTLGIDLTGWAAHDDGVGEPPYIVRLPGYPQEVHQGAYGVLLNQGSALSTTFSTQRDRAYLLTFWLRPADAPDNIAPDPLRVRIAGFTAMFPVSQGWSKRSFRFTSTSSDAATVLEFFNDSPTGDWRVWNLDDVVVKAEL